MRLQRQLVAVLVIAVAGTAGGFSARRLLDAGPARTAASEPAPTTASTTSGRVTTSTPTPGRARPLRLRHRPEVPRLSVDPRLQSLIAPGDVERAPDSVGATTGVVMALESQVIERLVTERDGQSLAACFAPDRIPEQVEVAVRYVATAERVAVTELRLTAPAPTPAEAACASALFERHEMKRPPGAPAFVVADGWVPVRFRLGLPIGR